MLFEFSEPVDNFGAWFGDLESRTDGEGETAYLKLYDENGDVLSVEPLTPNNQLPITGPLLAPSDPGFVDDAFGCGDQNQTAVSYTHLTLPTIIRV